MSFLRSTFDAPFTYQSQYNDFFSQLCETEGYSTRGARKAADELFKFLVISGRYPELRLAPSVIVDRVWRVLLLFPDLYDGVCSYLPNAKRIPYNPRTCKDPEGTQRMRYVSTHTTRHSFSPPQSIFQPLAPSSFLSFFL